MSDHSRKFLVGGNWKLNGSRALSKTITTLLNDTKWNTDTTEVVIAPPAPYLALVRELVRKDVGVAAQNLHAEKSGAFTGELSWEFLKDLGLDWAILGHSERRELFKEGDDWIALKTFNVVSNGVKVIFCIGEKLEEREAGKTLEVVFRQLTALKKALLNTPDLWSKIVIAYEPVWAIGTGKVATPQQAQQVHSDIRAWLKNEISAKVAMETRILYGGSVNGANCGLLQAEGDIDGFLVGGACLKEEFGKICLCRTR